jgi:hypothetical protein
MSEISLGFFSLSQLQKLYPIFLLNLHVQRREASDINNNERELQVRKPVSSCLNGSHVSLAGEALPGAPLGGHSLPTTASPSMTAHPPSRVF